MTFKHGVCALNLVILGGMAITVLSVLDQIHPHWPGVLTFLPALGTVSVVLTVLLLIVLAGSRHRAGSTAGRRMRGAIDTACLMLFIPYLFYWNLVGYRF